MTPLCSSTLKPEPLHFTSYLPMGRLAATNCPLSLEVNVRTVPVLSCKMVTSALGTAAPEGSVTVPTMVASWAAAKCGKTRTATNKSTKRNDQAAVNAARYDFEQYCILHPLPIVWSSMGRNNPQYR